MVQWFGSMAAQAVSPLAFRPVRINIFLIFGATLYLATETISTAILSSCASRYGKLNQKTRQ
jgi:hypothetical protein